MHRFQLKLGLFSASSTRIFIAETYKCSCFIVHQIREVLCTDPVVVFNLPPFCILYVLVIQAFGRYGKYCQCTCKAVSCFGF